MSPANEKTWEPLCLSFSFSVFLSIHLSDSPPFRLTVFLFLCLSAYLSL
jgi:hypothetical protein